MGDPTGISLYNEFNARMKRLGIPLENFVKLQGSDDVMDSWSSNPKGFHFKCRELQSFRDHVANNRNFAREGWLFELFEKLTFPNCAFREVGNHGGSLHIVFRFNQPSVIHLDSVPIVQARDGKTGKAIYVDDVAMLIEHRRVDEKHKSCLFYCK